MTNNDRAFWDESYSGEGLNAAFKPEALLVQHVRGMEIGNALDLGCGLGVNAVWLAEQGWNVTAVDWVKAAVEAARKTAVSHGVAVEFEVADISTWTSEARFDLVVNSYALPSKGDVRTKTLQNCLRALADNGTLFIVEWDVSMVNAGHWQESDLVSLDELVGAVAGLEVRLAEVVDVDMSAHLARESSDDHHLAEGSDTNWRASFVLATKA